MNHCIIIRDHAKARFHERVKPNLPRGVADRELRALVNQGTLEADLAWKHEPGFAETPPDAYLVLSDGIALALEHRGDRWIAFTCLTRGGMGDEARRMRNERRKKRRRRSGEGFNNAARRRLAG